MMATLTTSIPGVTAPSTRPEFLLLPIRPARCTRASMLAAEDLGREHKRNHRASGLRCRVRDRPGIAA